MAKLTEEELDDLERYNELRYERIYRTQSEDRELATLEAKLGI